VTLDPCARELVANARHWPPKINLRFLDNSRSDHLRGLLASRLLEAPAAVPLVCRHR
jgi:hypothetical protein